MTRASLSQTAGLLILAVWLVASGLAAQDIPPPGPGWSEPERWAWEEIRAGRIADFNAREGKPDPLDPRKPDGWGDKRKLSPDFLKEILFREPYRSAIPIEGVRIAGAWFPGPVDLAHGRLDSQLWLDNCRFEGPADLTDLHIDGWLFFLGSAFVAEQQGTDLISAKLNGANIGGGLIMDGATVAGTLTMDGLEAEYLSMSGPDAAFKHVLLAKAKVDGDLAMVGAIVGGTLDMNGLEVKQSLLMRNGAFQDVDLTTAKVSGQLTMIGATVAGMLTMNSLDVGQHLFMHGPKASFQDVVVLRGAKVGGVLALNDVAVAGTLDMTGVSVGDLLMSDATFFQDVVLRGAKVDGQLTMIGATVAGTLDMDSLDVGQHLFMHGPKASFQGVDLRGAEVGGVVALNDAAIAGTLAMDGLKVGRDLLLRGALLEKRADLIFAHIGLNLDLTGTKLTELDLSATRIEGELTLAPGWREGARLTLRNTHVGVLEARHLSSWPDKGRLQLDGFTYDRLGGYEAGFTDRPAPDDLDEYIAWLARDLSYTPQPYEQLAAVLRTAGEPTKANRILYESRERGRANAWEQDDYARWFGLTLLNWTIGYGLGLGYFRALGWVLAFTLIGTVALYVFRQGPEGLAAKAIFSLDRLLPIVQLDESHKEVEAGLAGRVKYYFYAHKLVGWVLASFLIAAFAGLTQE